MARNLLDTFNLDFPVLDEAISIDQPELTLEGQRVRLRLKYNSRRNQINIQVEDLLPVQPVSKAPVTQRTYYKRTAHIKLGAIEVLVCPDYSSVVNDQATHDKWHTLNDRVGG